MASNVHSPCNCCGTRCSKEIKPHEGITLRPGMKVRKEIDTPTLKIKNISTKAGPISVITGHV